MQVQFNVVGTEALHKAQEKPEDYQDLIVRIAGFSTYFVSLDKKTQDDFITVLSRACNQIPANLSKKERPGTKVPGLVFL